MHLWVTLLHLVHSGTRTVRPSSRRISLGICLADLTNVLVAFVDVCESPKW